MNIRQIVPVIAEERVITYCGHSLAIPSYGLDTLVEVMENCLPLILRRPFHNVRIASRNNSNK